jgi:hypothetical protein
MKLLPGFAVCLAAALAAYGQMTPNDYSNPKSWLCRPGQHDACAVDMTATIVSPVGKLSKETWKANPDASVDCFYVYPTVSTDPTPNSDMNPDPAEMNVIRQQFARFGSVCRTYAPMYRQVTLAGLRALLTGRGAPLDRGPQYDDVKDAWNYYLEHDNKGRPFVLVSHSQGSFILQRLVKEEIDGKAVQSRMVSALLIGASLAVPKGKDVGATFQHVPLCRTPGQTGCVNAYSSFRSTSPPPVNTRFGKFNQPELQAACTDPAILSGSKLGQLHPYFANRGAMIVGETEPAPWAKAGKQIDTPWVRVEGLVTGKCKTNENATYLEITVHSDPQGRRTGEIIGDLKAAGGAVQKDWGLHLIDMNVAMGNLVAIVGAQAKAFGHLTNK